jgi:hypothetical protein
VTRAVEGFAATVLALAGLRRLRTLRRG